MNVQDAVAAPRFHFQGGDESILDLESPVPDSVRDELAQMGYQVEVRDSLDEYYFGGVHAITGEGGAYHGGADPRRDGVALAY